MDYFTGMASSPIYEFPYSGSNTSSIPFLNYNPNALSSMYNIPQITPTRGNNTIIIQVTENMQLDTILRQLGVDVGSLDSSSSLNNYYTSIPQPIDFIFEPSSRRRRRRVICREVTDSESDDDRRRSSRYSHRRDRYESDSDRRGQSNARRNINSQWQAMQNASQPISPQRQSDISNVWNRAANASNQKPSGLSNLFNRMKSSGGNVMQPPPGSQQNQEAMHNFFAARNASAGMSQPNLAVANVWNRADNAAQFGPPPTSNPPWNQMSSQPPAMNSPWNQMSGGAPPPQQQPSSAMNSFWNKMSGGAPPPQQSPPPPMNPAWNQMSGGAPPPPPMNPAWNQMSGGAPPPPPMNSAWNQMSGAAQQQPPPATNSFWSKMTGAASPPQQPPTNPAWN